MQAQYKPAIGNLIITVDCEDLRDLLKQLSEIDDVFGEAQCGACGGKTIRYGYRNAKGYDFYEASCGTCKARLTFFSDRETGRLYPKRKDKEGKYLDKGGWEVWQKPAAQPTTEPDF